VAVTAVPAGNFRTRLKRIVLYTAASIIGVAALAYGGDFCVFHIRVASGLGPYGSVTVTKYYAVGLKDGKTEFLFDPPGPQTCSHSLFPQAGYIPCWYLQRHPEQRTDI
jgi:hypothetical protein